MRKEAVSLLGLTALALSIPLPFLSIKPNRVAEETGYRLWQMTGPAVLVGLIVAAALFAVLVLAPFARTGLITRSLAAATALGLLLAGVLFSARGLMAELGMSSGRSAPDAGFWIASLGVYLILYDGLRRSRAGAPAKAAVVVVAVAAYVGLFMLGPSEVLGTVQEYANRQARFWQELVSHLALSGASVLGATAIGIPLGMLAFRSVRAEKPVFSVASGLQTIPSLALFGLLIAPLAYLSRQFPFLRAIGIRGVGSAPAIIALVLYGLLPIVRNTYIGLKSIDRDVVDAGRGMGMSRRQLLGRVQIPIAMPIILTGVRITAVQTIGNAAVAALIGARGLGNFVFQGLNQAAPDLIVLGVVPIVVLAIAVDRAMDALIRAMNPATRTRLAP